MFSYTFSSTIIVRGPERVEREANNTVQIPMPYALHSITSFPNPNSNQIPTELRGIVPPCQIFGHTRHLFRNINHSLIQSKNVPHFLVDTVHIKEVLFVANGAYKNFSLPLSPCTNRERNKLFKNFESRFEPQLQLFNAQSAAAKLPNALNEFMLLSNYNFDSGHRISVLNPAYPNGTHEGESSENHLYISVSAVLSQRDTLFNET